MFTARTFSVSAFGERLDFEQESSRAADKTNGQGIRLEAGFIGRIQTVPNLRGDIKTGIV